MQERYLGDSHDYLKYAILRELDRVGFGPLGLAWYLTRPEEVDPVGNTDGEKRHHLTGKDWEALDPAVHEQLHAFADPQARSVERFETSGVLPRSMRFAAYDPPKETTARRAWWTEAMAQLAPCDVVFSDPDNGFMVKSATRKRRPKYALIEETQALFARGQSTISIQFARQCDPIERARATRAALMDGLEALPPFPVLRGRVAPNILFVSLVQPSHVAQMQSAFDALVARAAGRLELIA